MNSVHFFGSHYIDIISLDFVMYPERTLERPTGTNTDSETLRVIKNDTMDNVLETRKEFEVSQLDSVHYVLNLLCTEQTGSREIGDHLFEEPYRLVRFRL